VSYGEAGSATILGDGWSGAQHRSVRVSKVENGFRVQAAVMKTTMEDASGASRAFHSREDVEYVFYTVPEVLDFVRQYLEAPMEDLR